MKHTFYLIILIVLSSCASGQIGQSTQGISAHGYYEPEKPITQSLFNDKTSTISEENIQKILDGSYSLPKNLRVSLVKLESTHNRRIYYWNDEEYLKSQQEYLDLFTTKFKQSERVQKISKIPDLLISTNPTFTSIREAAVRTQSDIVVIYSINSDLYSKYKLFAKSDIKAFATTQLIILDVRTGLIPFSIIVTKEYQSKRQENELNDNEAANRIKNEAVLITIQEIGERINKFLKNE
ncbi:hypothetical protein VOI54_14990 [Tamlana sp. 2201CG12-4]|uniref:hypothetical protein n=1 Tax=Tamlana sp. 2201CG12-4 TaxID=3112582 RepID=UPI002DB62E42|nr:hypothetical protein [Tamlana sp. 2201CG12-4]MEC3908334.1 hypothetical protein [Tamlana sp. 2201CG12-4]